MKKRELVAAVNALTGAVTLVTLVVLIGPGHVTALLNIVASIVEPFLWFAAASLIVLGLPIALLIRLRDTIRRSSQKRPILAGPLLPRWRNGVMIWHWSQDTHRII